MNNKQKVKDALSKEVSQMLTKLYPETTTLAGWEFRNLLNAVRCGSARRSK